MSEDLNLPASLERLEISPERQDGCRVDENQILPNGSNDDPDCSLESLSLKAVCPKGNCQCNKRKERQDKNKGAIKRLVCKRPILRRSKLRPAVLRAPILKLPPSVPILDATKVLPTGLSPNLPNTSKQLASRGPTVNRVRFQTEQNSTCTPNPPQYSLGEYSFNSSLMRGNRIPLETINRVSNEVQRSNSQNCCAVQARIAAESPQSQTASTSTDDTNIDELASYFDLFVHIPKKMSLMAEMMYI